MSLQVDMDKKMIITRYTNKGWQSIQETANSRESTPEYIRSILYILCQSPFMKRFRIEIESPIEISEKHSDFDLFRTATRFMIEKPRLLF